MDFFNFKSLKNSDYYILELEDLFEKYEELTEKFQLLQTNISKNLDLILKKEESGTALTATEQRNKKRYNTNTNAVGSYLQLLDQTIAKEATCEILVPLYSKNFEENKNNPLWIRRAAGRLDGKECSNDPHYGCKDNADNYFFPVFHSKIAKI